MEKKVLYRTESFSGSGVRDAVSVLTFEVCDLANTDILAYCLEHYSLKRMHFNETLQVLKDSLEDGDAVDEQDIRNLMEDLLKHIESETSHTIKYALWLAEKKTVLSDYGGTEESVEAYECGQVILSNLGEDGILYGYQTKPIKIG